jgi:catechol 2,3-dioxygenase-like lactoylglutathione lyase family enzyme
MRIASFDHVALYVSELDRAAEFTIRHLGMRELERSDEFRLVGSDPAAGKLTFFSARGTREPGMLASIGLRVRDLDSALRLLPAGLSIERSGRQASFSGPENLPICLVKAHTEVDGDLDHVRLRMPDPARVYKAFERHGLTNEGGRLRAANAFVDIVSGSPEAERPLLNHLGFRVESLEEQAIAIEQQELEVVERVDAPNTRALFVRGPGGIKIEYVEHKPSFMLA